MSKKLQGIVLATTIILAPVAASAKCDTAGLILDDLFTHGSVACNPAWMDRPASYFAVAQARTCRTMSNGEMTNTFTEG
jgi:hypothetical protein